MNFSDCFTRDGSGVLIPECPLECWTGCKDTLLKFARPPPPPPRVEPVDTGISPQAAAQKLYTPIPVKPWQTRLLRICNDPGPGSSICCRLLVVDVIYYDGMGITEEGNDKEVSYIALSYEWGRAEYPRVAQVNGISFPITENLFQALRALRSAMGDVYLWADALCINQYNEAEKSIQVRRMQTIYRKASQVVAWNPHWDDDMHSIFTKALNLEIEHQNIPGKANQDGSIWSRDYQDEDVPDESIWSCNYQDEDVPDKSIWSREDQDEDVQDESEQHSTQCLELAYRILATASDPPLFRRIWVRQEVHNARNIHCQYQDVTFPLENAIKKVGDLLKFQNGFSRKIIPAPLYSTIRKNHPPNGGVLSEEETDPVSPKPMTLMEALRTNHLFQATDPRDYIYGVLGLTSVRTTASKSNSTVRSTVLDVDYSQTMSQVFQSVVVYLIRMHGHLGVLSLVDRKNRDIHRKLPSWTPDWTSLQAFEDNTSWEYPSATFGDQKWKNMIMGGLVYNDRSRASMLTPYQDISYHSTSWQPDPQCGLDSILSLSGLRLGYIQGSEKTSAYQEFEVCLNTSNDRYWRPWLSDFTESIYTLIHSGKEMRASEGMEFRQATLSADGDKIVAALREASFPTLENGHGLVIFPSRAYVPQEAIEGNEIILLQGSRCPFLVQRHDDGIYEILGAMGNFPLCFANPIDHIFGPYPEDYWESWWCFHDMIEDNFEKSTRTFKWSRELWQRAKVALQRKAQFEVFKFR